MKHHTVLLTTITAALFASRLAACDFCSCELPSMGLGNHTGLRLGVSEQYTHFGTLQLDGRTIANPAGEYLNSSITQIVIGYDVAPAFSMQLSVPLISRSYRRWYHGGLDTGTVSGIGDISFVVSWAPIRVQRPDFLLTTRFYAGISLPTGDSSRVLEEAAEGGDEDSIPSGIHGHDLALGTGSVSGIFGVDTRVQWKQFFATLGLEGTARTNGAYGYTFAAEMSWYGDLGGFLVNREDFELSLAAECTGSSKGQDVFQGTTATDTSGTIVYLGPKITAMWKQRYHAEITVGIPVLRENSGVQSVPNYRISAAFGYRF